jgi:hypothetical protein
MSVNNMNTHSASLRARVKVQEISHFSLSLSLSLSHTRHKMPAIARQYCFKENRMRKKTFTKLLSLVSCSKEEEEKKICMLESN